MKSGGMFPTGKRLVGIAVVVLATMLLVNNFPALQNITTKKIV